MACIPKHLVQQFKEDLKAGKINFDALIEMSSEDRRKAFAKQFGEANSESVNAKFESKILLKMQKKGMIDWIKTVANLKPETKRDILSRVNRMEKVLQPKDDIFLEDLAARRLGVTVTSEEAATISELAKIAQVNEENMNKSERRTTYGRPTSVEMDYGSSVVAFEKYLETLKSDKRRFGEKAIDFARNPGAFGKAIADSAKSLKASFDNSFIGRQGARLFYMGLTGDVQSGKTWMKTFFKSFDFIFKTFRNQEVLDTLRAEILSDPQYDLMRKAKIATATVEEEFPISWPTRLPFVGKVFKAAETAFVGSAYYMRYRTAKQMFDIAERTGVDLTDKAELEMIGKMVNSLTARGDTGAKSQKPGLVNALLWSPRMIKANLDVLTAHIFDKNITPFVRKRAAVNLLRIITGQAAVLFIAGIMLPDDSIEWDPRSANFGKIRIGNTRFDVTGGMSAFTTLAARTSLVLTNWVFKQNVPEVKSSLTGKLSKLAEGFRGRTGENVVYDFFANKLSPASAVVRDIFRGRTFQNEMPTWITTTRDLAVPIPVTTFFELKDDPNAAFITLAMIAEGLGISVQKYGKHISTWTRQELLDEVTDVTYKNSGKIRFGQKRVAGKMVGGKIRFVVKGQPHIDKVEYHKALKAELARRGKKNGIKANQ